MMAHLKFSAAIEFNPFLDVISPSPIYQAKGRFFSHQNWVISTTNFQSNLLFFDSQKLQKKKNKTYQCLRHPGTHGLILEA
jgi:hypothetical protein